MIIFNLVLLSAIQTTLSVPLHPEERIVNGVPVMYMGFVNNIFRFPWMVSLRKDVEINGSVITDSFCGATLIRISPPIILTAAHCIDYFRYNISDDTIRNIDDNNRINYLYADINRTYPMHDIPGDAYVSLEITDTSQFIIHEKWNGYTIDGHDIAVIIFPDHNITINRLPTNIPQLPAKLSDSEPCCMEDEYLITIGYGSDHTNGTGSLWLEFTVLKFLNIDECQYRVLSGITNWTEPMIEAYITDNPVTNSILGVIGNNTDICHGDSGGPIFRAINNSGTWAWEQLGVASFGFGNCNDGLPSFFTSIAQYYDWLNKIIIFQSFGDTYHPTQQPTNVPTTDTTEPSISPSYAPTEPTVAPVGLTSSLYYRLAVVVSVIFSAYIA